MAIDMSHLYAVFMEEAQENLDSAESLFLKYELANLKDKKEIVNGIFRAIHSLKGGSETFKVNEVTDLAHIFETMLDFIRKDKIVLNDNIIKISLETVDVLKKVLLAKHNKQDFSFEEYNLCYDGLVEIYDPIVLGKSQEGKDVLNVISEEDYNIEISINKDVLDLEEQFGFFDESLKDLNVDDFENKSCLIGNEKSEEIETDNKENVLLKNEENISISKNNISDKTVKINVDKIDDLVNLMGEILISKSILEKSLEEIPEYLKDKIAYDMHVLERNLLEMKLSILSVRMLPISMVFNRFPRLVNDMSKQLNKNVGLTIMGENTELDKGLIEKIADPLTHLIRNSIDHGIESPEKRVDLGKPKRGSIVINAYHQGDNIVIEVADDGAGLNREKILSRAKSRGIYVKSDISDSDVWEIIFESGFSTAEQITEFSGRGVGMDVVKRNIIDMGGRLEVSSTENNGTRVILRLPLTLAILNSLSVLVGNSKFLIHLTAIVESFQVDMSVLNKIDDKNYMINYRGKFLPLVFLSDFFGIKNNKSLEESIVMIVMSGHKTIALLVDEILDEQQVVIKSIEKNFRKIDGVSGGTIVGDGKVAMILDLNEITEVYLKQRMFYF